MSTEETEKNPDTNNTKIEKKARVRDPNVDYSFIKRAISEFIVNEHFYGRILSRVYLVEDWNAPTAYVTFDLLSYKQTGSLSYKIGYNPAFIYEELGAKYQVDGVLKEPAKLYKQINFLLTHELLHMLLSHLSDRNIYRKDKAGRELVNIAMDLAINSMLSYSTAGDPSHPPSSNSSVEMIDCGFYPGVMPKTKDEAFNQLIAGLPILKSTMFYYNALNDFAENREDKGDGSVQLVFGDDETSGFDAHEGWENLPKEIRDQIKALLKAQIQDAINNARKNNSWGNASQHIQELMLKIASENQVDWTQIIQFVVGQCRILKTEGTYRRRSKKLPDQMPGVKRMYSSPLAFFIDQSGSMSNEDVQLAFSQAASCAQEIQIDVFNFDTEVDQDSHEVWKKNNAAFTWKRTRGGGTDFNAVKAYLESPTSKHKKPWKWVVIVTDGYADVMNPIVPRLLWLITPGGKKPDNVRPGDLVFQMKKPGVVTTDTDGY